MCYTNALIPSIGGTGTHNSRLGSIYPGMHSQHATPIQPSTLLSLGRRWSVAVAMYIMLLASFGSLQAVDSPVNIAASYSTSLLKSGAFYSSGTTTFTPGGTTTRTGSYRDQSDTASVQLTLNGNAVTIVQTFPGSWINTLTGQVNSNNAMSGSWTDNHGGSGTWTMTPPIQNVPESDLTRGTAPIADGGTDTVRSSTPGVTQVVTYTITNSGAANLTTSETKVIAGSNCSAVLTTAPGATIAPSKTSNAVLSITPTALGAWTATVSIITNDADENPYNWTISGTAAAPTSTPATPVANQSTTIQPALPVSPTLADPAGSSSACGAGSLAGLLLTLLAGIGLGCFSRRLWPSHEGR